MQPLGDPESLTLCFPDSIKTLKTGHTQIELHRELDEHKNNIKSIQRLSEGTEANTPNFEFNQIKLRHQQAQQLIRILAARAGNLPKWLHNLD